MNRNDRHLPYRRRVMRRRRLRFALLLSGILLVLGAAAFLVFGNLLADRPSPEADTDTDTETVSEADRAAVPTIQAHFAVLESKTDTSTWNERLSALSRKGATAVSAPLNRADGSLLYRSDTAMALGLGGTGYSVTLSSAASRAEDRGLYFSGVWHLSAMGTEDDLLRSVALAKESALIAEAFLDGVDDILLILPSDGVEDVQELIAFASDVRSLCSDGNLGLCLPSWLFESDGREVALSDLSDGFDYLAIDATAYGDEDPASYAGSVAARHLDLLLRHRMRLLLPVLADPDAQDGVIAAAEQYNITNWQWVER